MFGWLKKRLHKDEEYGDIKSHVLGEEPSEAMQTSLEPTPLRPEPFGPERFRREPMAMDTGIGPEFEPRFESRKEYDIMDKLNMIEAHLSAIRSQTETINERLKNLELRLGRRF